MNEKPKSKFLENLDWKIFDFEYDSCTRLARGIYHLLNPDIDFDKVDISLQGDEISKKEKYYKSKNDEDGLLSIELGKMLNVVGWQISQVKDLDKERRKERKRIQIQMIKRVILEGGLKYINFKYLSKLASSIGMPTFEKADENFYNFLFHYPEILSFDYSFNAGVDSNLTQHNIPILKFHKSIIGTIELISPILTSCILQFDKSTLKGVTGLNRIHEKLLSLDSKKCSELDYVKNVFGTALRDISNLKENSFRWSYDQKASFFTDTPVNEFQTPYSSIEFGALCFIELHELSHLLLGHPERGRTEANELEADRMAIDIIGSAFLDTEALTYIFVGIYMILEFFHAKVRLEKDIQDLHASSTPQRISQINKDIIELFGTERYAINFQKERESALDIFRQTFHKTDFLKWVVSLSVDEINKQELRSRIGGGGQYSTQIQLKKNN